MVVGFGMETVFLYGNLDSRPFCNKTFKAWFENYGVTLFFRQTCGSWMFKIIEKVNDFQ